MNVILIKLRKVITTSFLSLILGGASLAAFANGNTLSPGAHNKAATAEVKFIPATDGQGVFNVRYDNAAGSRFCVQIEDAEGNMLYQDIFTDKKFDKNYRLADPDSYHKLVFIIRNLQDNSSQRFELEVNTHLIEDVNVQEIK
jgi:lipopolysaccharide export LptBFGC system permease protein LptF